MWYSFSEITRVVGNKKGILTRQRQPKAAAHVLRMRYLNISTRSWPGKDDRNANVERVHGKLWQILAIPPYKKYWIPNCSDGRVAYNLDHELEFLGDWKKISVPCLTSATDLQEWGSGNNNTNCNTSERCLPQCRYFLPCWLESWVAY